MGLATASVRWLRGTGCMRHPLDGLLLRLLGLT